MYGKIVRDIIRTLMLQRLKDIQNDFEQYSIAKGKPVQDLKKILKRDIVTIFANIYLVH